MCARFIARLSVLAPASLFAACAEPLTAPSTIAAGDSSSSSSVATTTLTGVWKLQSLTTSDGTTVTIDKPELFTLEFSDASRLAARFDCNRGAGSFALNGDIGIFSVGLCMATRCLGDA